jgi:hypothetical protein
MRKYKRKLPTARPRHRSESIEGNYQLGGLDIDEKV